MAKLPEIEYGPVEHPGAGRAQLTQAVRGALDVVSQGLELYSREIVKTSTMHAAASLAEGLADLQVKLTRTPYLSAQAIRDELGADVDALPPEVKQKLTQQALDIPSGAMVDVDREQIPTYEVAGAIFDVRARRILEAASQGIPGAWKGRFEHSAADDILAKKTKIAQVQARNFAQDQRELQAQHVDRLVRAGEFDMAQAAIGGGELWTQSEKEKLSTFVEHGRQVQPFEDIILRGIQTPADVMEAGKLIGRLESGQGVDQLEDKERIQRKQELERHVAEYDRRMKYQIEHAFDAQDAMAQDILVDAMVQARGGPLPFSLVPRSGDASPKMREHITKIIEGTQKNETVKTDPAVYDVLARLARDNPKAFIGEDLLQYVSAGRLSMEHFTRFADLQRTIKEEGTAGARYSSFVGPQEETDRLLLNQGIQVQGAGITKEDQKIRGYVHSVVDSELFRATVLKGKQLEVDERNKIIQSTVAREFRKKPWYRGGAWGAVEVPAAAVDPVAPGGQFQRTAIRLGVGTDQKELTALATDFEGMLPAISTGWRRATPKTLRQGDALAIYEIMRREQARIDAALRAEGKAVDEANRAAVATQLFLGGMR